MVEQGHQEAGIAQMIEGSGYRAKPEERRGGGMRIDAALLAEAYGKAGQTSEGLNVVNEELAKVRIT